MLKKLSRYLIQHSPLQSRPSSRDFEESAVENASLLQAAIEEGKVTSLSILIMLTPRSLGFFKK